MEDIQIFFFAGSALTGFFVSLLSLVHGSEEDSEVATEAWIGGRFG